MLRNAPPRAGRIAHAESAHDSLACAHSTGTNYRRPYKGAHRARGLDRPTRGRAPPSRLFAGLNLDAPIRSKFVWARRNASGGSSRHRRRRRRSLSYCQWSRRQIMRSLDEHNITQAVVDQLAATPDPRLKQIMTSLISHLHDFAREVKLTEAEWLKGIQFLTAAGQKCDEVRQELIMLSDTLGLSQLVVAQSHSRPAGATEQTVLGPFHIAGAPPLENGADIARGATGAPCYVRARVSADGKPLAGATVDIWQADAAGRYDVQQPHWTPADMKLRAVLRTGAD